MDFDNNHFIAAGNGISGILYGTKRAHNSLYDGKGSKQPSTYHKETCGFKAVHDQPLATQRSNGLAVGGAKLGSGILCNGVDFHRFMDGYIAPMAVPKNAAMGILSPRRAR